MLEASCDCLGSGLLLVGRECKDISDKGPYLMLLERASFKGVSITATVNNCRGRLRWPRRQRSSCGVRKPVGTPMLAPEHVGRARWREGSLANKSFGP